MSRIDELIAEHCPDGVEFKPLGDLVVNLDRLRRPVTRGDRSSGQYPYYGANGVQDFVDDYLFDGTFLLIGEDGSVKTRNGTPILTWASGRIWVNNHAHVLQSLDDGVLDLRFLYFALQTTDISSLVTGGTQPKLNQANMNKIPVPVPPLEVQRQIVRILDEFTALEAELEAELNARRAQYEHYRDSLLTFTDDTMLMPLGEFAEFQYGFTASAQDEGDHRFVRITDISPWGKLSPDGAKFITASPSSCEYVLSKGDLLMARTGATFGKTLLVSSSDPAVYASFLIRIKVDQKLMRPDFYWHFAQSTRYWMQANSMVSTGGQPQFNANSLRLVKVPVPPLEEQDRIVSILDHFDALVNDLSVGLPAELAARRKQYEYYRDKLLTFEEATP